MSMIAQKSCRVHIWKAAPISPKDGANNSIYQLCRKCGIARYAPDYTSTSDPLPDERTYQDTKSKKRDRERMYVGLWEVVK